MMVKRLQLVMKDWTHMALFHGWLSKISQQCSSFGWLDTHGTAPTLHASTIPNLCIVVTPEDPEK